MESPGLPDVIEVQVNREVELKLTQQDLAERAIQFGTLIGEIEERKKSFAVIEDEFKRTKEEQKDEISKLQSSIDVIGQECKKKRALRTVEVTERKDYNRAMIQVVFEGEVIEERTMSGDELQRNLFEPVIPQPEYEAEAEKSVDEQIIEDIQESTNPRTATSAVQ